MGHTAMTEDFMACLEDRSRLPLSDFAKAKRDLQIAFAAYESLALSL